MLSYKECIKKLKEAYPDMYPTYWINLGGAYIFSVALRGVDRNSAIIDFHMVNPEDGSVSGSIPLNVLMRNDKIAELLKHPHKVDPEDQKIEHSLLKIHGPSLTTSEGQDYLAHHGIIGQKWGVRRFQNPDGTLTAEGKARYSGKAGVDAMDPDALAALATVSLYAAFFAALPVYVHIKKNSNHKKWKEQNDAISEDYLTDIAEIKDFSDDNKPREIKGEHSVEQDMAAVNPKYGQPVKGNSSNCVLCSATYDLRRRGYDVTAKLCSTGMYTEKVVKEMYEGVKEDHVGRNSWTQVTKAIEKRYPEGSRGIISVTSIYGGHAMSFEIHNGKAEIIDAQSAQRRKLTDKELSIFDPTKTRTFRLDDKKVKMEGISIACAELKPGWEKTISAQKKELNEKRKEAEKRSNEKIAAGVRYQMNAKQILEYKREHPGTKLTDKEILNNIFGA